MPTRRRSEANIDIGMSMFHHTEIPRATDGSVGSYCAPLSNADVTWATNDLLGSGWSRTMTSFPGSDWGIYRTSPGISTPVATLIAAGIHWNTNSPTAGTKNASAATTTRMARGEPLPDEGGASAIRSF